MENVKQRPDTGYRLVNGLESPACPPVEHPRNRVRQGNQTGEDIPMTQEWLVDRATLLRKNASILSRILHSMSVEESSPTEKAKALLLSRLDGMPGVLGIQVTSDGSDVSRVLVYVESRHSNEADALYDVKHSVIDQYPDANLDVWIAETTKSHAR